MSSGERPGLDEVGAPVAAGFETRPEAPEPLPPEPFELSLQRVEHPYLNVHPAAAEMLVDTVFGGTHHQIPRLRYATAYKLAEGRTGGDIIDVFHYDNDHVSIAVADIAGKGPQAAACRDASRIVALSAYRRPRIRALRHAFQPKRAWSWVIAK